MYKILLVDDENLIIEGLRVLIMDMDIGFTEIELANNGMQALEKIENFVPDIIITDIRMPIMNGLEMIKKLRGLKKDLNDIKVIVLSGHQEFNYAVEAMKYGVTDYLIKPLDSEEIYKLLCNAKESIENKRKNQNDMEKTVIEHNPQVNYQNNKSFFYILDNKTVNRQEITMRLRDMDIVLPFERYLVMTMELKLEKPSENEIEEKYHSVIASLKRVTEEDGSKNDIVFYEFYIDSKVVLLFSINDKCPEGISDYPVKRTFEKVIAAILRKFDLTLYIGVSDTFFDISGIAGAYEQSCHALKYRLLKDVSFHHTGSLRN